MGAVAQKAGGRCGRAEEAQMCYSNNRTTDDDVRTSNARADLLAPNKPDSAAGTQPCTSIA